MTSGSTGRLRAPLVGLAIAVGAAVALAGRAEAASICFPPGGGGVPGQPGLPNWWTGTAPYDDPRWIGSYGFSHGVINFNALIDNSASPAALVLRWHVKPDPGPASAGDMVTVGFFNTTTNAATIVQLTRDALTTTTAGGIGAGVMSASAYTRTGTSGGWSSGSVPSALASSARLDAACDTSTLPVTCDDWVIRLRVPLTAAAGGVELGSTFDMWYQVDADHGGTATADRAKWPTGATDFDPTALPLTFPEPLGSASPASAAWFNVSVSGGMCAAGIGIQSSDISVANAIGAGTAIDVNSANTFHAKPTNNTTTVYNPNSIKANLRIADWGSAVGNSPRWNTIPDPSCAAATGTGAAGSIGGGTHFDLTCAWTLTAGQKCSYRPDLFPGCTPDATLGTRYPHQCIMAELSSTAAPIPFSVSSAWNNFDFDHSSRLERKARLDIGTLGPRDVYVYVKASHLPAKVDEQPSGNPDQGTPGRGLSALDKERLGALAALVPGRVGEKDAASLRGLVAAGRLSYDDVEKLMPTYAAYVWHDSGATVKTATGTQKLLAPQPAFTLFVAHDGPLYGWTHGLAGAAGATVTAIAPNFYKISIGPGGTAEVVTTVEALEHPPVPPRPVPPTWTWFLLGLVLLLLVILLVLRATRKRTLPPGP